MAIVGEQSEVAPRTGSPFTFTRTRSGGAAVFFPGAGSTLRFANRDVDTFTARDLPAGLLMAGDTVTVAYFGATVFRGEVKTIADRRGRGDVHAQDVVVAGPWDKLQRLVFRQTWRQYVADAQGQPTAAYFSSSRVILNQDTDGTELTMSEQIEEIVEYADTPCGISMGANAAPSQYLPLDEARDITCADAIRRELRFFPKLIVRFDYSESTPELVIAAPSGSDAAYVATIPKTDRTYQYDAHPVSCVDVAVDAVDVVVGGASASYHQIYPANGDPDSLDCLHVTIPLSPGSASTTQESFESVTEDIPADYATNAVWWKRKHPRLADVAIGAITITNGKRLGEDGNEVATTTLARIAKSTKGEIEAAGLHCAVHRFTCDCKISITDYEEENIRLTMDFLVTDARTRTYTWQNGGEIVEGETLPDGLAEALYRQRSGSLAAEEMTVRLGAAFPQLGDAADGLYLQNFEVDVYDLTARLSFGRPEHLSAEDMRSLLNGFRQRGYASTARIRKEAADEDADEAEAPGGIPPISSSEWAPGQKVKTVLKKAAANGGGVGAIRLDATQVPNGETVQVRTLTFTSQGSSSPTAVKVLATNDVTIPPGGGGITGTVEFMADADWYVSGSTHQLRKRLRVLDLATGQVSDKQGTTYANGWEVLCNSTPISSIVNQS